MKYLLSLLILAISFSTLATISTPCKDDHYTLEEMGEYYYYERMKITNSDGDLIGSLLINFNLGEGAVDGVFLCGASKVTQRQTFFGLIGNVDYEEMIKDGSELNRAKAYINKHADTHSISFSNSAIVSENKTSYVIETTLRLRALDSGRYTGAEKVYLYVRKSDYLYE